MGKPLDTQSKVYGLVKINEFYFFIFILVFTVFAAPTLFRYFGFTVTLVLVGFFIFSIMIFLVLSNQFPENFFLHYILFKVSPQVFKGSKDQTGNHLK